MCCCRYSYGPVKVDATSGAFINVSAVASYAGSVITMYKDGVPLSFGGSQWQLVELSANSQSTIILGVYNEDSGVTLEYELIVIRPRPDCTDTQLSQW